jgi:hypothetical protein
MNQESLDRLQARYERKGFITLDDVAICFESTSQPYTINIIKMLVLTGWLQQVQGTVSPIKYSISDPYKAEVIDMCAI